MEIMYAAMKVPSATQRRPFTVIGGFLGTGKTTLVNHILSQSNGTRYAVLVNDFGAVNIDAGLIASHDGQTMALTNGCICCSLADGFVQTMLRLMQDPNSFDHVIVEASGVAQPSRIMDFARLDPLLEPDAIVTLVDADNIADRLADPLIADAVTAQIATADILVLNKMDLAGQGSTADAQIDPINPVAPRLRTTHADVPLQVLLGTGIGTTARSDLPEDAKFHTGILRKDTPINRANFQSWADALDPAILRGKGFVWLTGEATAHLWQRVGQRMTLTPTEQDRETELVLISTRPLVDGYPEGLFRLEIA